MNTIVKAIARTCTSALPARETTSRDSLDRVLSAFGELFEKLAKERGMSKRDLAALAGVSSGKLTESLRDYAWAKEHNKRWYGPDISKVEVWADAFELAGEERKRFVDLAHLAHAPAEVQKMVADQRLEIADLKARMEVQKADVERIFNVVTRFAPAKSTSEHFEVHPIHGQLQKLSSEKLASANVTKNSPGWIEGVDFATSAFYAIYNGLTQSALYLRRNAALEKWGDKPLPNEIRQELMQTSVALLERIFILVKERKDGGDA